MIHRLALSHALGSQKRFVVRTDRRHYQADDQVLAHRRGLRRRLRAAGREGPAGPASSRASWSCRPTRRPRTAAQHPAAGASPQFRKGVFETRFTVFAGGRASRARHRPVHRQAVGCTFQVTGTPVERQRAVRNVDLQQAIAAETGGKSLRPEGSADIAGRDPAAPPRPKCPSR